jgi:hypothetical protein
MSRLVLGPTQPPKQWVPRVISLVVKQLGHESDHSLPFIYVSSWHDSELRKGHEFMEWESIGTTLYYPIIYLGLSCGLYPQYFPTKIL